MPGRKKAADTGKARNIVTLSITPEANRLINEWCDRTGGSKTRFAERLVAFWAGAPESVQRLILGDVPQDLRGEVVGRAADYFASVAVRGHGGERPEISESGEPGAGADAFRKSSRPAGSSATEDSNGSSRGAPPAPGRPPSHPR